MLIVRVELHAGGIGGPVTELGRMEIVNDGTSSNPKIGHYNVRTLRGRNHGSFDHRITQKEGRVEKWRRLDRHVWYLVAIALAKCGYGYHLRGKQAHEE